MRLTEFKPTFRSILELFLEVSGQFSRKWGWWLHSITIEVGPIFPLKGLGLGSCTLVDVLRKCEDENDAD